MANVLDAPAARYLVRHRLGAGGMGEVHLGTLVTPAGERSVAIKRLRQAGRPFDETSPLVPRNPYAASKAAADGFVTAFHHTHGMDTVIARCANNYGPRQFPEKLIPVMILNALDGRELPVYGDGLQIREWIHVDDACEAVDTVLAAGRAGEVYNVGAENERVNLEVVRAILRLTARDESLLRHVPDRPGHDRRYAMSAAKIRDDLGWRPRRTFDEGLAETVGWYRDNRAGTVSAR